MSKYFLYLYNVRKKIKTVVLYLVFGKPKIGQVLTEPKFRTTVPDSYITFNQWCKNIKQQNDWNKTH